MVEQLSTKVDKLGKDCLVNVAKTSMSSKILAQCVSVIKSKLTCRDDDLFAPLAVDAMLAVKTINPRGEKKYPVKAVNVLKAHGKSARESFMVHGYALNCTVASQGERDGVGRH